MVGATKPYAHIQSFFLNEFDIDFTALLAFIISSYLKSGAT